jgi:chitinase
MASRIAQLEDEGIGVGISFGGQANTEPAAAYTDAAKVASAYESVLTRYHVHVMDLDVVRVSLTGSKSACRRAVEGALNDAHAQLATFFRSLGLPMSGDQVCQHIGATVMIGQNNDAGEVFTTGDAAGLKSFANRVDLKRISMWSLNRDSQCETAFSINTLLNVCSGTP